MLTRQTHGTYTCDISVISARAARPRLAPRETEGEGVASLRRLYTYIYIYIYVHAYNISHIYIYIYMICIYIYIYIYIYMYTYIHTVRGCCLDIPRFEESLSS